MRALMWFYFIVSAEYTILKASFWKKIYGSNTPGLILAHDFDFFALKYVAIPKKKS